MDAHELIFDWNLGPSAPAPGPVELNDETLRDGLQCPTVRDPAIEDKLRLLHRMADLGIASADIGLPGAGPRAAADAEALAEGVDRIHGTALGIGERCGNTEMDLLLVNLKLMGAHPHDLSRLPDYIELAARAFGVSVAHNWPVFGEDAFRTGTGVHAAAISKAQSKGDAWLADRVYSGVPAGMFGRSQRIEISPMSGLSNVRYWLEQHGYDGGDERLSQRLFSAAKRSDHTLTEDEVHALCAAHGAAGSGNSEDGPDASAC